MRYVTAEEMRAIDRAAIESGTPAMRLMESAGRHIAEEAMRLAKKGSRVAVFAGYGNNGGDGLVAARYLAGSDYKTEVFFVGKPKDLTPETNSNLESLFSAGVTPKTIAAGGDIAGAFSPAKKPDIIIDAIFGIGVRGPLDAFFVELIKKINSSGTKIVSADIPSGLDADTGRPMPEAVKATVTVAMGYPKAGFKNEAAKQYIGRLVVADIGLGSVGRGAVAEAGSGVRGTGYGEKVLQLRQGKKGRLKKDHPWIYKGQILKAGSGARPGNIVSVIDAAGAPVGRGYYNPRSDITVRLLTFTGEKTDQQFFDKRLAAAAERRKGLLASTNAYRAVFSEADGLPGLIVDMYADTAVFQALTLGMETLKPMIMESVRKALRPRYIYEKSVSPFRRMEGLEDAKGWWGDKGVAQIEIFEGKARFLVDIEKGHKTGFYLDQRKSRMALAQFAKDKSVLDLFCYTGGFSVSAAMGGASRVRGCDIKEEWLALARKNAGLNGVSDIAAFGASNAFDLLREIYDSGERFDIIVVDPPSFTRSRRSVEAASKGYKDINMMAMKALTDGGILATFSCSHNMPNEIFSSLLKRAARDAKKAVTVLKRCHQAEDHPIVKAIPETEYLKGYFLKVGPA